MRKAITASVAAVVVLGLAIVAVVALREESAPRSPRAATVPPTYSAAPPSEHVHVVDGLTPRFEPATVALGPRLFVFGGLGAYRGSDGFLNDGVIADPASGRSRALPPPPFERPLADPSALSDGRRVLVVGRACTLRDEDWESEPPCTPGTYDAAIFDHRTDRWRALPIPGRIAAVRDGSARAVGSTRSGLAIVRLGIDDFTHELWAVALASGRWTRLPATDRPVDRACVLGDEVAVLQTRFRHGDRLLDREPLPGRDPGRESTAAVRGFSFAVGDGYTLPSVAVLVPGQESTWRTGPEYDGFLDGSVPEMSCLDRSVVVTVPASAGQALLYSVADGWSPLPLAPVRGPFAARVWTGTELVLTPAFEGADGLAFDVATRSWSLRRDFPVTTQQAFWSGDAIVGYEATRLPATPAPGEATGAPAHARFTYRPSTFSFLPSPG